MDSKQLNIENFFHDTGNGRIFCTLIGPRCATNTCLIYFSPLFEERMWSQRIAFNFAQDLAAQGKYTVLIFDYYGYGESEGEAEEFTLARCRQDVENLLSVLRKKGFSRFAIWGIHTGCAVALSSIPLSLNLSSIVLWEPVFGLKKYIYDGLRATITTESTMFKQVLATRDTIIEELLTIGKCVREGYQLNCLDGYRFGRDFYKETLNLKYGQELNILNCPSLLINIHTSQSINIKKVANGSDNIESQQNVNLQCIQVIYRKFWLIGRDYSVRAEPFFKSSLDWLRDKAT